jgi:hypothetical protein
MNQPIFITGADRSGSSLIAKIFQICGVFTGVTTNMLENIEMKELCRKYIEESKRNGEFMLKTPQIRIPVDWRLQVDNVLGCESCTKKTWMFKSSQLAQMWPVWHYAYPNARWIIVRRRTGDIIQSCMKTGYMRLFKEKANLDAICAKDEEEGWKWWVHQYEKKFVEMIEAGVNCKIVWPERMVTGDYQQIYETLEWLGLQWSTKIVETIDPMLIKSRRKEDVINNS